MTEVRLEGQPLKMEEEGDKPRDVTGYKKFKMDEKTALAGLAQQTKCWSVD